MAAVMDSLEGQTLGSCRVERLLGRGRLSAVYLGQQAAQPVAITAFLMPASFSSGARERFLARFQHEAQALVSLHHPRVLPIYEYGVQYGYPYLVTPYAADGSLANVLKQRGRCTPAFILQALEQIAAGLDYAHSRGVVHGTLKPANVLLHGPDERDLQVAGFGLVRILEMRGIEQSDLPYAHLLNIAGTFLGTPEYSAPECVQGQPADARSDIYALGILLFELLSGNPPFTGSDPLAVALQHTQQPLPSLRALCPALPPALEAVVNQALARDPAQRFQSGAELVAAFVRALSSEPRPAIVPAANGAVQQPAAQPANKGAATGNWQILPPVVTGHLPVVLPVPAEPAQVTQPMPPAPAPVQPGALILPAPTLLSARDVDALAVDPFEWWSKTFTGHLPAPPASTLTAPGMGAAGTYGPAHRPTVRGQKMKRRQVVAALAAGGLLVAGFGGLSLAHMLEEHSAPTTASTGATGTKKTPTQGQLASKTTATPTTVQPTPKPTTKPMPTPTHTKPTATPTSAPSPTPTPTRSVPTPTPSPSHTGTVIGRTSQAANSANNFNNPADGHGSLLIHLPNGNFVAYEKACTHEGVAVYYDGGSHQLVCPAHGARFDPANGGNVLQGPANSPLPRVTIRVNGDGTITTG